MQGRIPPGWIQKYNFKIWRMRCLKKETTPFGVALNKKWQGHTLIHTCLQELYPRKTASQGRSLRCEASLTCVFLRGWWSVKQVWIILRMKRRRIKRLAGADARLPQGYLFCETDMLSTQKVYNNEIASAGFLRKMTRDGVQTSFFGETEFHPS